MAIFFRHSCILSYLGCASFSGVVAQTAQMWQIEPGNTVLIIYYCVLESIFTDCSHSLASLFQFFCAQVTPNFFFFCLVKHQTLVVEDVFAPHLCAK